jgi:hypothetical protein
MAQSLRPLAPLLVALLAGCAAASLEANKSFLPADPGATGIVIVSVTSTGQYGAALGGPLHFTCESGASGGLDNNHGLARYIDGERLSIPIPATFPLTRERPMGRIHVVELPAGNCAFDGFSASASGNVTTTSFSLGRTMRIAFVVRPNTTQYVGNFNMDWSPGRGRASWIDSYDRDMAVARQQNPALQNAQKSLGRVVSW